MRTASRCRTLPDTRDCFRTRSTCCASLPASWPKAGLLRTNRSSGRRRSLCSPLGNRHRKAPHELWDGIRRACPLPPANTSQPRQLAILAIRAHRCGSTAKRAWPLCCSPIAPGLTARRISSATSGPLFMTRLFGVCAVPLHNVFRSDGNRTFSRICGAEP